MIMVELQITKLKYEIILLVHCLLVVEIYAEEEVI